jgi:beta-lactam-binding protein with PASTA domain
MRGTEMKTFVAALLILLVAGIVVAQQDDKGPVKSQTVAVPKIVDQLSGVGRKAVTAAGLVYELAPQGVPTSDPNKNAFIAKQSPDAGTQVMRGSKVIATIYVFQEKK